MAVVDIVTIIALLCVVVPVLCIVLYGYGAFGSKRTSPKSRQVSLTFGMDRDTDRLEPPGLGTFDGRGVVGEKVTVVSSYTNHVRREHWNDDIVRREGDWTSD